MSTFLQTSIPTYNLICHFVPGVILVYLLQILFGINLLPQTINSNSFVYSIFSISIFFVIGVIVNRIGSYVLRYLVPLKQPSDWYAKYIEAKHTDPEIAKLIEMKELYKSMIAVLLLVPLMPLMKWISTVQSRFYSIFILFIYAVCFYLFQFFYRKQDGYINKRVDHQSTKAESDSI